MTPHETETYSTPAASPPHPVGGTPRPMTWEVGDEFSVDQGGAPHSAVEAAARALVIPTVDTIEMYYAPASDGRGTLPFGDRYTSRDDVVVRPGHGVWQACPVVGVSGPALVTLKNRQRWDDIERTALAELEAPLAKLGATPMDIEVMSVQTRRRGASVQYRVTVGPRGVPATQPFDRGEAEPRIVFITGKTFAGISSAAARIADVVADMVDLYRDPIEDLGGEIPFSHEYADRHRVVRTTEHEVWQCSPSIEIEGAAVTALKTASNWDAVERAAREALGKRLPDDLDVMDVQVTEVHLLRQDASLDCAATIRRAHRS